MADDSNKNDLAQDRTDWAEDRTVLAGERTFAGWISTGMASIGLALGLKAVFREAEPTWLPKLVAVGFVAIAIAIFWAARDQAVKGQARLETHATRAQPRRRFTVLSVACTIGAVGVGFVLWTL